MGRIRRFAPLRPHTLLMALFRETDPADKVFFLALYRGIPLHCGYTKTRWDLIYIYSYSKSHAYFRSDFGPAKAAGRSQTRPVERESMRGS